MMSKLTGTYRWKGEADLKLFAFDCSKSPSDFDMAVLQHIVDAEHPGSSNTILLPIQDASRNAPRTTSNRKEELKKIQDAYGISDVSSRADGQRYESYL